VSKSKTGRIKLAYRSLAIALGYAYGWVKMDDHPVTDIVAALNGAGWVDLFGRTTDGRIGHMFQFHQSGQPTGRLPWTSFFFISDGTVALDGLALGWLPKNGLVAWASAATATCGATRRP